MLIEYVRQGKYHSKKKTNNRIKKGVLVAIVCNDNVVRIGWSLCKFSSGDKFTIRGMEIAIERAMRCTTTAPHSIILQLNDFIERTKKYYKDKEVISNNIYKLHPDERKKIKSIHKSFKEDNIEF